MRFFLLLLLFLPISVFAETEEGWKFQGKVYTPVANTNTDTFTYIENTDNLTVTYSQTLYDHPYNYAGVVTSSNIDWSSITTQYMDYSFDWTSGTCNIIHKVGDGDPTLYNNFKTSITSDISRTVESITNARTNNALFAVSITGTDCVGELVIYDLYNQSNVSILNFVSNTEVQYIPVEDNLISVECVNNSPTSTCSFTYSSSTSSSTAEALYSLIDSTKESPFTVFNIFIFILIFFSAVIFIGTLTNRFL